jgi:NADH-quinone oxidoreductase subunit L
VTTVKTFAWICLLAPLAGSIVNALLFKVTRGSRFAAGLIGTGFLLVSFAAAVVTLFALQGLDEGERQVQAIAWDLANTTGVNAQLGLLIDPLSVYMMLVVSGVSSLIHLYAVSYMASDRGYTRFFSYLNFFVFSMLLLVMAGNFVLLIVGWAFVGAASYLLISFWYRRETATRAGIKAFVINVLGDVGLVLGTFFIFRGAHSLDFLTVFREADQVFGHNDGDLIGGLLLLLVGAFAKSAQVPLHTWLPDAMEGPTPVSALIHAATMVTAGVYLICRMWPLFEITPAAAAVGACIGALTLFIAATIALTQTDLKRVIAYSTMSQIGYMVMAVCSGAYVAGMFHLMTHAFFKALLFMAAGSVISAMASVQDLDRMGGFRRAMPFTFGCFVVGGLALAGVPPFSGFFSKDEILAYVAARDDWHIILAVVGYVVAFMTAIYTWRMIFRTFYGEPVPEAVELEHGHLHHEDEHRNPVSGELEDTDVGFPGPEHHIAEREPAMKAAMGLLAVGAIFSGFLQIPQVTEVLDTFFAPSFRGSRYFDELEPSDTLTAVGLIIGTVLSLAGIALAYRIWVQRPGTSERIRQRVVPLYTFLVNKWYFDELIDFLFVRPGARTGALAQSVFERVFIDRGVTGGTTGAVRASSAAVRAIQTGFLRNYAGLIVIGMVAVTVYFLLQS